MSVLYGELVMPEEIKWDAKESSDTFARFVAEPFERGYGYTVGNSLRRILLTSLEAPAIVSVAIEGIPHEYMAIDGIIEDMTNIILNLKGALLRKLPISDDPMGRQPRVITSTLEVTEKILASSGGQYKVTLGDIISSDIFEVMNPELYLFTVTQPTKRQVTLRVMFGKGYVPSERHQIEEKLVNEIVMDAAFSPVSLVNYWVENTRVGQHTDFDKLIIEVTTDDRITPFEALGFASQIGIRNLEVFVNVEEKKIGFDKAVEESCGDHDVMMQKLTKRIDEIELSVRSTNCLNGANIESIAELVIKHESDMLRFRNFGKKSLNEIKAKLTEMSLFLGMDLSKYGIEEENVRELVLAYREQHAEEENA
jgi:DNA-directed RNA polymerase subunit alpha